MAEHDLTLDVLRQTLAYDESTGIFSRIDMSRKVVGRISTKGYRQISVNYTRVMAHRLAWFMTHGQWPDGQIDHINQNKDDNRLSNLRLASNKQNAENITMFKHNKSGRRGVRWASRNGKWIAEIKHMKKNRHLGLFENIVDAVAARMRAERELFTHYPVTH